MRYVSRSGRFSSGFASNMMALGAIWCALLLPGCEPTYQGKSLQEWGELLGSSEHGEEAAGALENVVQDETLPDEERRRAVRALLDSGVRSPAVLDALEGAVRKLEDDLREERLHSIEAIGESGMPGIPRLISLLEDDSHWLVPWQAARSLEKLAYQPYPHDREEIHRALLEKLPWLVGYLERFKDPSENGQAGGFIAQIFGRIGPRASQAVPVMSELLDAVHEREFADGADDELLAGSCLMAIRDIGPAASAAIPTLRRLLDAPDDHIKHSALEALQHVSPSALKWPELLKIAQNKGLEWIARDEALEALAKIEDDSDFLPAVLQIVQDRSDRRRPRAAAAQTLAALRRHGEDKFFEVIRNEMNEASDPELGKDFAYALSHFGPRAAEAARLIAQDLDSDKVLRPEHAARALARIGPPARPFVPKILPLLENPGELERYLAAIQALASIGAEKKRATDAALTLVKGENAYYAGWAAAALRDLVPESLAVLDELREVHKKLGEPKEGEHRFERSFRKSLERTIAELEKASTDAE